MKALLLHASSFGSKVENLNELDPQVEDDFGIELRAPSPNLAVKECLVALFHIEQGDGPRQIRLLCKDIDRVAQKLGTVRLVVACFGHLSSSCAPENIAFGIYRQVLETCYSWGRYKIYTSPFGKEFNKTLDLRVKSHRDAVKHRSY